MNYGRQPVFTRFSGSENVDKTHKIILNHFLTAEKRIKDHTDGT